MIHVRRVLGGEGGGVEIVTWREETTGNEDVKFR